MTEKVLKELIKTSRYITYATVNEDCSPQNSPMFFISSEKLDRLYMGTHPESLHIKNMLRTGQAFGVIFGHIQNKGVGLYFKLENCREATGAELDEALAAHNTARANIGKSPLEKSFYEAPNPQRMYILEVVELSTNGVEKNNDGLILKDTRANIVHKDIEV